MAKTPDSKSALSSAAVSMKIPDLEPALTVKMAASKSSDPEAVLEALDNTSTSSETKAAEISFPPTPDSTTSSEIHASTLSSHLSIESNAPFPKPNLDPNSITTARPDSPLTPLFMTLDASDNLITPTFQPKALKGNTRDPFPTPYLFTTIDPKPTSVQWFKPSLRPIPAAFRQLLETYSGIPPSEVEDHVENVRNTLWRTHPYPCIGMGYFLRLDLSIHPLYHTILSLLRTYPTAALLDLGCGLGQDLRKCAFDLSSTPSSDPTDILMGGKLLGIDVSKPMVEAGGKMFRDEFPKKVWVGDLMEEGAAKTVLEAWGGKKPTMAFVGKVFHLFGWGAQVKLAAGLVRLLVAGAEGNGAEGHGEVNDRKGVAGRHADDRAGNAEVFEEQKWWKKAYEEGFRKGYEEGRRKGYEAAMYEQGFKMGFAKGYEKEYGSPPSPATVAAAIPLNAEDGNITPRALTFNHVKPHLGHNHSTKPDSDSHTKHLHHNEQKSPSNSPATPLLIFGDQLGVERDEEAGLQQVGFKSSKTAFIHSPGTLQKFWAEVGEATGTRWEVVTVAFENVGPAGFNDDGTWGREEGRLMKWGVRFEGRI